MANLQCQIEKADCDSASESEQEDKPIIEILGKKDVKVVVANKKLKESKSQSNNGSRNMQSLKHGSKVFKVDSRVFPYSCEFCGQLFRFKRIMTTHRREHIREKPYICIICGRYMPSWILYWKHVRTHSSVG